VLRGLSTDVKRPNLIYSGFRSMKLNRRAGDTSAIAGSKEVSSGDGQALQRRLSLRAYRQYLIQFQSP